MRPSDAPLNHDATARALALLRTGVKCTHGEFTWSYVPQTAKYLRATRIYRDNETLGEELDEDAMRKDIARYPAVFREMLVKAM